MPDYALLDLPDGLVVRRRKIFEIGDYPDKNFSLDLAEAQAAIAAFTPAPLDIEHVPSVLDGKLGTLQSLALDADQKSLFGDVAIPAWLDRVLDGTPVKLSALWNRLTKRLEKVALVLNPRIPDAVLMSAFTASLVTPEEVEFLGRRTSKADQQTLQSVHDQLVKLSDAPLCPGMGVAGMPSMLGSSGFDRDRGQSPRPPVESRSFAGTTEKPWSGAASRFESTAAYCNSCLINDNTGPSSTWTQDKCHLPVKEPDGTLNLNAVRAAASAVGGGRTGSAPPYAARAKPKIDALMRANKMGDYAAASAGPRSRRMRLAEIIQRWAGAGSPPVDTYEVEFTDNPSPPPAVVPVATLTAPVPPAAVFTGPSPREQQLEAEVAQQRAAVDQLRRRQRESDAEAFWAAQFSANKVVPAEKAAIIADYLQRAQDDDLHGLVAFADGSQTSRIGQLHAAFAVRPTNPWTQSLVAAQGASVLPVQYGTANPMQVALSEEQERKAIDHDITAGVERYLRQTGTDAERARHAQRYGSQAGR